MFYKLIVKRITQMKQTMLQTPKKRRNRKAVKRMSKIKISQILSNKSILIPFSIIVAIVVWLAIVIVQNPVREQVFTDVTAAISTDNTAASELGLGIVSDLSKNKFTVIIKGPNYIVSSLKSDDFILTADITDINAAGTYSLDISS